MIRGKRHLQGPCLEKEANRCHLKTAFIISLLDSPSSKWRTSCRIRRTLHPQKETIKTTRSLYPRRIYQMIQLKWTSICHIKLHREILALWQRSEMVLTTCQPEKTGKWTAWTNQKNKLIHRTQGKKLPVVNEILQLWLPIPHLDSQYPTLPMSRTRINWPLSWIQISQISKEISQYPIQLLWNRPSRTNLSYLLRSSIAILQMRRIQICLVHPLANQIKKKTIEVRESSSNIR